MKEWKEFYSEGTIIANRRKPSEPFGITIISSPTILEPKDLKDIDTDSFSSKHPDCKIITLKIGKDKAEFKSGDVHLEPADQREKSGIEEQPTVTAYWLSFNRDDRELKYGKGYVMEETTYMTWKASDPDNPDRDDPKWDCMFKPENKRYFFISEDVVPQSNNGMDNVAKEWDIYPYPLTKNWPYLVKDSATATMVDIANKNRLLSANLPSTCRELYAIVASPTLKLDSNLSDAIENSLKDGFLAEAIAKKKKANPGGMSDYLRINLGNGSDCGSAPRHLELWQPGAGSSIHNHGNAYGVIKVVHGKIKIMIYNKQWDFDGESEISCKIPLVSFTASENDVTWLSPNWYQTHKLKNHSDEYCATIQCYKYGKNDQIMWPYFDYWENGSVKEFKREDDMEFDEMCTNVLGEYELFKMKNN